MKIFLDSGAFSVWNKGRTIDINRYIDFCHRYEKEVDIIANLDVIPGVPNRKLEKKDIEIAVEKGFINHENMLASGLQRKKLLHTFHQGDPDWALKKLVAENEYIGVSPANDKSTFQRKQWMDSICMPILTDCEGKPKVKFHGFAVTSLKLAFDYPWYSVDSSSWRLRGGGFGLIDLPCNFRLKTKQDFYIRSLPISKGVKKYTSNSIEQGFFSIERISQNDVTFLKNPRYKEEVEKYLHNYSFSLDLLSNNYVLRSVWNAIYLMQAISKFTNISLYLATNDLYSIKILFKKLQQNNIDLGNFNVLVSYAAIANKQNSSLLLDRLIKLKHIYNEKTRSI